MKITLDEYLMEREKLYPEEYTFEIRRNAWKTVDAVNVLLYRLEIAKVPLEKNPKTGSIVSSGWRPPQINGQVKGAAVKSKHLSAQACDLYDPEGMIDEWVMTFLPANREMGLWAEHPSATKGWSHVQVVPPPSNRVIFFP